MHRFLFFAIFSSLLISCTKTSTENYFESMNTFMKVQCYGKNSKKANDEAQKYIKKLENLFSVTNENSEIYKINNSPFYPVKISSETSDLLEFSLEMAEKTSGAFNPCLYPITSLWGFTKKNYKVPQDDEIKNALLLTDYKKVHIQNNEITLEKGMMLDLGGIAKGYAANEAAKILESFGVKSALLDLGGNIQTIGKKADGSSWHIGIRNPFGDGVFAFLEVNESLAVVTSAGYERFFQDKNGKKYIHIFDAKTGKPVENDVVSATAISKNGGYSDALSTALFVMGFEKARDFWKKYQDFDFIIVTNDKKVHISSGIEKNFHLIDKSFDIGCCRF